MLTVIEAADELKCSPNTIRAMCKRGDLPHVKAGNRYRIDLDRAWAEKEQKNNQATPITRRPDEVKKHKSNNDYLAAIAALRKLTKGVK